jgi:hypothetical protein
LAEKAFPQQIPEQQTVLKRLGGNNEDPLSTCPCRIGNQLCFADRQQKDAADLPIVQQRDLLGVAQAIGEFGDLHRKLDEAYGKNDPRSVGAFYGGRAFCDTRRNV